MNNLKQNWKDYIVWLVNEYGYMDLNIGKCNVMCKFYMPTKRRADTDNMTPKFVMDGLTEAHMIIDDDYLHCNPLTIWLGYDKEQPRMEIIITTE